MSTSMKNEIDKGLRNFMVKNNSEINKFNQVPIMIGDNVDTTFLWDDKIILSSNTVSLYNVCNIACDYTNKTPKSNIQRISEIFEIEYVNSNKVTFSLKIGMYYADNGKFVLDHTVYIDVLVYRENKSIRSIYVKSVV